VVMIQEVAAGHGQGQWSAPGIMIATGTLLCFVLFVKAFPHILMCASFV